MKKLFFIILFFSFSSLLIIGCNDSPKTKSSADSAGNKSASPITKEDSANFTNGTESFEATTEQWNTWTDSKNQQLREMMRLDMDDKIVESDFPKTTQNIDNYKKQHSSTIGGANGFSFTVQQYRDMLANLGVNGNIESRDKAYGTRVYPALESSNAAPNKMYLVFIGDTITVINNDTSYQEMLNSNFSGLRDDENGFKNLKTEGEKNTAISDIKRFQKRFYPNKFQGINFISVVNKAKDMINTLKIGNAPTAYGLRLIPSLENRRFYFVSEAESINQGVRTPMANSLYDHMNECPSACPDNGINN